MTKPVLEQARDIVYAGILHRAGEIITPSLAMERARNITAALIGLLCDQPPVPTAGRVARHLEDVAYPTDEEFNDERIK